MRPCLTLPLLLSACVLAPVTDNVFRYQNPISDGLDLHGVRDCQVFRDGDRWYMTATAWPHWPSQETSGSFNHGVVLYSSDNLVTWKFERVLVPAGGLDGRLVKKPPSHTPQEIKLP